MIKKQVYAVRNKAKKTISSMIALVAVLLIVFSASAVKGEGALPDLDRTGSITVILYDKTDDHSALPGEFKLFFVARAEVSGHDLGYVYNEDFADCGLPLSDLNADGLAEAFSAYAAEHGAAGITGTQLEEGGEIFTDLAAGLYLVEEIGSVEGYEPISPFLVCIPMTDSDGSGWIYDIIASPKAEPSAPPEYEERTVRKVWVDEDNPSRPVSVTVRLMMDGTEIDSVILNEANEWTYTWTELPAGHSYTVAEDVPFEYVVSYAYGEYEIVVTNTARLPRTGQLKWPIPVLAVSGAALLALGIVLTVSKRSKAEKD